MKLQALYEVKYAVQSFTVMINVSYLFLIENMLYDRATLVDQFGADDIEIDYNEKFLDDILGHEHDTFDLIRIENGYAHARPTAHGEPDFIIDEDSFDRAIKDKWLEVTG